MRKAIFLSFLALSVVVSASATARAEHRLVQYAGMHPIPAKYGGGFCYIEYPHVHVYKPVKSDVLYRHNDDGYAFVGDPVPYGYDGPKQAYYGPHPIYLYDGDVEYCYINGPHYHPFAPAASAHFRLKGGVYFYADDLPHAYYQMRPRYSRINAVYRPLHYARPVVVEAPPPEYRGPVYVEEPAAVVTEPAVVGVGMGVHAEAGVGFHAGVGVGAGVVVGAPAPVVVEPAPAVIVRDRPVIVRDHREVIVEHRHPVRVIEVREHDRGKHKGWRKHGGWGRRWH